MMVMHMPVTCSTLLAQESSQSSDLSWWLIQTPRLGMTCAAKYHLLAQSFSITVVRCIFCIDRHYAALRSSNWSGSSRPCL